MLTKNDYFLYLPHIRSVYAKRYHKTPLGHDTSPM